jgi:dTDP-4-amino-4,6-dideoxygalactose transaminase
LPESERAANEVLSLPIYPGLTEAQIARVARAVAEAARA